MTNPQSDTYTATAGQRLKVGRRAVPVTVSGITPIWSAISSMLFQSGTAGEMAIPVSPPSGHPTAHPLRISLQSGSLPAGVTLDSDGRKLVADGSQAAGTASGIVLRAESPLSSTSRWRKAYATVATNPFANQSNPAVGNAKHVWWEWHPIHKRIYTYGGDYGRGVLGTYNSGAVVATPNGPDHRKYEVRGGLRSDMFSFDPYCMSKSGFSGPDDWRLEHPYFPRDIGGSPEQRPGGPDQASMVWDPEHQKFWVLYSVIRNEFIHECYDDGTADPWAVGELQTNAPAVMAVDGAGRHYMTVPGNFSPAGTYSWIPSPSGGAGTWTKETTARLRWMSGATTQYVGNELQSGAGDERIGQWALVPGRDRLFAFGNNYLFAFNRTTLEYEYWPGFVRSGSGYWNMSMSCMAVIDNWIYGVAWSNHSTYGHQCLLVGFDTSTLGANTTACNQAAFRFIELPWDLDKDNAWTTSGTTVYGKLQEHAGVVAIDRKIVVACTYTGIVNTAGTTRMFIYDHDTQTPDDIEPFTDAGNLYASSWAALPDTGELMMGLSTAAKPSDELFFYRVR